MVYIKICSILHIIVRLYMVRENLEFYFKRINDALISYVNNELRDLDLTFSQMEVLQLLFERKGENIYQKDIEKHFNLSHPTVIGILKRLQAKDLVKVKRIEEDKRKRNIVLTDKVDYLEEKMFSKILFFRK